MPCAVDQPGSSMLPTAASSPAHNACVSCAKVIAANMKARNAGPVKFALSLQSRVCKHVAEPEQGSLDKETPAVGVTKHTYL